MLDVLDTTNSRLQNADNSLVQNTANNSEQQDRNSLEKINAAKTAFGRELTEAEKSAVQGLGSLPEANQWIEQQGLNWAKQNAAKTAFGRELTEAEKSAVQGLGSLQDVNAWIAQKGQEWGNVNAAEKAFGRGLSEAEKSAVQGLGSLQDVNAWIAQKGQEWFNNQFNQQYTDLATGADRSADLSKYLKDKFQSFGLTSFADIEKQVIPAEQINNKYISELPVIQRYIQKWAGELDPKYKEQTKYYNKATGQEIDPVLFDDKVGTKYILTDQGIQKQFDPLTRFAAQLTTYVDPSSTGGAWGTKGGKNSPPGFGPEGMMRQIASRVQSNTGVSDINDLGVRKVEGLVEQTFGGGDYPPDTAYLNPKTNQITYSPYEIYNKKTGQKIRDGNYIDLGGWGEGPGITYASMTFDANGKPKISTYGEDTNTLADYQPLMTLASIIPSPIQPFAVAANAANAAYNYGNFAPAIMAAAGASGILDSIAGTASNVAGPAGELASNSGIAGLAQDLGASANLANSIGKVGAQTLLGGTLSAAQGKGVLPGAKSGFVSSVIGEGVNTLGEMTGLNKGLGSLSVPAKSLATSALVAKALNRPFDLGQAVQNAAINYGLNKAISAGGQTAGFTPSQQKALINFLKFAAPIIAARR